MRTLQFPGTPMSDAANLLRISNELDLEAVGVWFKLQCADIVFGSVPDDDVKAARMLGLDPRVWRRNRAVLERTGHLTSNENADAVAA